jgi:Asp-tRNA(Asn)/Glu-tRNA(Gln) amidotransferase A subunit family amidase
LLLPNLNQIEMKKLFAPLMILFILAFVKCNQEQEPGKISTKHIASAEALIGLEFTQPERDSMLSGIESALGDYEAIREYELSNDIPPALLFNPLPYGFAPGQDQQEINWKLPEADLPEDKNDLAFYTVPQLASLIESKKITSVELTRFFIARLKEFGDTLKCVITLTEERALDQAQRADEELSHGIYRSPLHGIPYGAKDLLSVPGYKTTWGAMPYKDQVREETASVIQKLEDAGAVMVAKLSMGALAMDNVWFGGATKNPWDLEQGSSGSSAGSAAATSAGLVGFSIGTETWGSIVSPSNRCGVTGLRPTFGAVSRHGAMALSWTMDKIGPICRSAEGCAMVFEAIHGKDEKDPYSLQASFNYRPDPGLQNLRAGYFEDLFKSKYGNRENDSIALEVIQSLGITLSPVHVPDDIPINALGIILWAEASAAFDELTRSNRDDLLVLQTKNAWPNFFRQGRFVPAVEYIQASRIRTELIREVHELFSQYDVILSPSFGGNQLLMTNLTGHPCVVMPNGFSEKERPTSFTILGNLFDEATILAVAKAYQDATEWDEQHPPLFD